jgi:flavin-dependent dehydrogenase
LNKQRHKPTVLKDESHVSIIGGGPAGSFFAILLLQQAKQANRSIAVTIIEKKSASEPTKEPWQIKGCNCCAGGIAPRLHDKMKKIGIRLPHEIICEEFTHVWIHGLWKNFPLRIPPEQKMYSVFRGTLPSDRKDASGGFDNFILNKAAAEGARVVTGEVRAIHFTPSERPLLTVSVPSGDTYTIESDFAVISAGINPNPGKVIKENEFIKSYQKINPRFVPPKVRRTLIFELKPGRDYLKKYMHQEIYFIESGSGKLRFDHIALIPKGEYLTVALVGDRIDKATFPRDAGNIIDAFLSLPHIRIILPHITSHNTPVPCICSPYMATGSSKEPFGDRIAVIGDASGARLYMDGLYSAFISAQALAETVIHQGTDRISLSEGYGQVVKWLEKDIRYGKLVFGAIRMAFSSPLLSRIVYQAFATEMKFKEMDRWPLGNLLRKIGSGTSDYEKVFRELFAAPVVRSVLKGVFKTARNILTEIFFGINWEEYGRYPTVILKEKRDYFKESIATPLGIKLDARPEMERMYAIKIRASAAQIFEELGKFGDAQGKFLRLRFVDVRRISGQANQAGAVVRYRLRGLPVHMDIRLARCIPGKILLYEPGELFSKRGKLIFEVSPTKDGNCRLVVYTAFDFRRGRGVVGRRFWKLFKQMFPDYAHDVVWNHAICCIKGEVEKRVGGTR